MLERKLTKKQLELVDKILLDLQTDMFVHEKHGYRYVIYFRNTLRKRYGKE